MLGFCDSVSPTSLPNKCLPLLEEDKKVFTLCAVITDLCLPHVRMQKKHQYPLAGNASYLLFSILH